MAVYRDITEHTIVVWCDECPHWSALTLSLDESFECLERHKINVHGIEPQRARQAREAAERRARHAVVR